jgi:hypothetical protein
MFLHIMGFGDELGGISKDSRQGHKERPACQVILTGGAFSRYQ